MLRGFFRCSKRTRLRAPCSNSQFERLTCPDVQSFPEGRPGRFLFRRSLRWRLTHAYQCAGHTQFDDLRFFALWVESSTLMGKQHRPNEAIGLCFLWRRWLPVRHDQWFRPPDRAWTGDRSSAKGCKQSESRRQWSPQIAGPFLACRMPRYSKQ
ncbi:hypothetical protein D3C80_935580 [compost metagenome]